MNLPRLATPSAAMRALDRIGWTAGLAVAAYGRSLGVRVNDAALLRALPARMPCGSRPARRNTVERLYSLVAGRRSCTLYTGAEPLASSPRLADILDSLEQDARLFVAENARTRVFVHAAVVAWNGRAILIPGRTMSGKTTLAAAFVRAGATYYSDEYAVLDTRGRVHPYSKPLSIRDADKDYTQTDFPAEYFGGRSGKGPIPVGTVLVTDYREGARWRPRLLSRGVGIISLFANTIAARTHPEQKLDTLRHAVLNASVYKSSRGEAVPVVRHVLTSLVASNKAELKI